MISALSILLQSLSSGMKWSTKHLLFLLFISLSPLISCRNTKNAPPIHHIAGKTMGTYYSIKYNGDLLPHLRQEVDSVLRRINGEVSTYVDTSILSIVNRTHTSLDLKQSPQLKGREIGRFLRNYRISDSVFRMSDGDFDPTIMPLVNYWGFGYAERKKRTDTVAPDSIRRLVGMHKIHLDHFILHKDLPGMQLDFSAVAKGDAVDEIARYLSSKAIQNYLVDIGGEVLAKGMKRPEEQWIIGINVPREHSGVTEVALAVPLQDAAIATSGNYRNYYTVLGRKYSHTINPTTGKSERNNLLSASILAHRCAWADALATACMVKGMPEAYHFIQKTKGVEGCFIYSLPSGRDTMVMTDGFMPINKTSK